MNSFSVSDDDDNGDNGNTVKKNVDDDNTPPSNDLQVSSNKTALQTLHHRLFHTALVHDNRIVVLGGFCSATDRGSCTDSVSWPPDEIVVYDPTDLSWTKQVTTGEVPPCLIHFAAQVVGDELYVLLGVEKDNYASNADHVFVLDLSNLVWRRLEAAGEVPTYGYCATSWTHDGEKSIVTLREPDRLSVYDTIDKVWRRPTCKGCVPPVAAGFDPTAFAIGSKAYVFGAATDDEDGHGTLCRLDMETWTWEEMSLDDPKPRAIHPDRIVDRRGYTFTLLPPPPMESNYRHRVLLYGGQYDSHDNGIASFEGNCWILHLDDDSPSYRWQRCDYLDAGESACHEAVVEVGTGQVWLLGGFSKKKGGNSTTGIRKLTVTRPLSLAMSCFKTMAEEREGRLKRGIVELPQRLQSMFRNYVELELGPFDLFACDSLPELGIMK